VAPLPAAAVSDNGTAAYSALINDYGHFFQANGQQELIMVNDCSVPG
jgi:hypothetical protein